MAINMNLLLLLAFLISPDAFAEDVNSSAILVRFNSNDGQWLSPRDEYFQPGLDLDVDQDKEGRLLTVQIDLNNDGLPESFLRILCGTGGCEYPIFDGRTSAYLGTVFGHEVWLLKRRLHALPIIESLSKGSIGRYHFDGSRYNHVSSQQLISDEETQLLYKRLDAAPRVKAQK